MAKGFNDTFRATLRAYLEMHEMSIAELSRRSGVGYPSVYSFLKGPGKVGNRATITLESADKIAAAIGRRIVLE